MLIQHLISIEKNYHWALQTSIRPQWAVVELHLKKDVWDTWTVQRTTMSMIKFGKTNLWEKELMLFGLKNQSLKDNLVCNDLQVSMLREYVAIFFFC